LCRGEIAAKRVRIHRFDTLGSGAMNGDLVANSVTVARTSSRKSTLSLESARKLE
jgi:hypothetical protein